MATRYIQGNNEVQGSNDGVAPAAGYVGETVTSAAIEFGGTSTAGVTLGTFPLSNGIWAVYMYTAAVESSGTITACYNSVTLTTNSALNPLNNALFTSPDTSFGFLVTTGNVIRATASRVTVLNVTSPTTYYMRAVISVTGGGSAGVKGYGQAVRIA